MPPPCAPRPESMGGAQLRELESVAPAKALLDGEQVAVPLPPAQLEPAPAKAHLGVLDDRLTPCLRCGDSARCTLQLIDSIVPPHEAVCERTMLPHAAHLRDLVLMPQGPPHCAALRCGVQLAKRLAHAPPCHLNEDCEAETVGCSIVLVGTRCWLSQIGVAGHR